MVVDLGSGLLDAACPWLTGGPPAWLASEPAVRQTLVAGAALVTFSGDKLLGGPQAGVIAGRADLIEACAAHPLYRVARPGGLVLAALQEVALAYLDRRARDLPFWRMATAAAAGLRARAETIAAAVGGGRGRGLLVGGGRRCPARRGDPVVGRGGPGRPPGGTPGQPARPIVARVTHGETLLDLRTVAPAADPAVAAALATLPG